jgi:AAA domain
VSLPSEAERLDAIVASYGARLRLVVIDPWAECLDAAVDSHHAQSLRRAIAALRRIAMRHGVAVVVIAHLNKSVHTSLRRRIDGSGALYDASRSLFLFARDPDDEAVRVLAHDKWNDGTLLPAREYRIEPILVPAIENASRRDRALSSSRRDRRARRRSPICSLPKVLEARRPARTKQRRSSRTRSRTVTGTTRRASRRSLTRPGSARRR